MGSSHIEQALLEEVLKMFPPASFVPVDKKTKICPKCKKSFKVTSIEGIQYKTCGCTRIGGETK
jgi:hypothetical protein